MSAIIAMRNVRKALKRRARIDRGLDLLER